MTVHFNYTNTVNGYPPPPRAKLSPDLLDIRVIGGAESWHGRIVRGFFVALDVAERVLEEAEEWLFGIGITFIADEEARDGDR